MDKQAALKRLAKLAASRSHIEAEMDALVGVLRGPDMDGKCEATWREVGEALGLTPQAVQQRWRELSWQG